ncbi:hypothetical protein LR69_00791 [Geobacillus sp. BCO2]|nr:hypothetical protein LR69_00791 [Geobacillus sp. BCO2]
MTVPIIFLFRWFTIFVIRTGGADVKLFRRLRLPLAADERSVFFTVLDDNKSQHIGVKQQFPHRRKQGGKNAALNMAAPAMS